MIIQSIVRQSELINNIKNQVYVIDNNYNKYKDKILTLAHSRDSNGLMKQLFWKPHIVLSIIVKDRNRGGYQMYPLFGEIGRYFSDTNPKFVIFFLNCLFFYSFVMLKESDNQENKFLKKYFNWGFGGDTMASLSSRRFYGLRLLSIVEGSIISSIVNLILTKQYLKVFTFIGDRYVCCLLFCHLSFVLVC